MKEKSLAKVSTQSLKGYLRFDLGAISFTPPGFSSVVAAAAIWSSFIRFSEMGDVAAAVSFGGLARFKLPPNAVAIGVVAPAAVVGFFNVFLEGGGGMSSTRPWFLNCELKVLTVFGRFSGSFRTSIEIDDFLVVVVVVAVALVCASSDFGFFGIFPNLSKAPVPMTLVRVSLSLSACASFCLLLDDFEVDDDEELEDLCELLRSLSLEEEEEEEELPLPLELLRFEEDEEVL